ncbi:MAG: hypothetical protein A2Y16_05590 [Tenericutes bacterium GWF2_57_13]|nr:MAG: hypothetical protein A2Y16_05590 [Tenericutes bacterium GWF2_57_13]
MPILKMFVKGFLLLSTSIFIFSGMMIFTDALGLDVMPAIMVLPWSHSWWEIVLTSSIMIGVGTACGLLLRHLTKRWNQDVS